jgi:hypothetical protein
MQLMLRIAPKIPRSRTLCQAQSPVGSACWRSGAERTGESAGCALRRRVGEVPGVVFLAASGLFERTARLMLSGGALLFSNG